MNTLSATISERWIKKLDTAIRTIDDVFQLPSGQTITHEMWKSVFIASCDLNIIRDGLVALVASDIAVEPKKE